MSGGTTDARAGLTEWLRTNRPDALMWTYKPLYTLTRRHAAKFGRDGFESACWFAALKAWDGYHPTKGKFGSFFNVVARRVLIAELKRAALPCRADGYQPLDGDGYERAMMPERSIEDRDAVEALRGLHPKWTDTIDAFLATGTVTDAAKELGMSRQRVDWRLRQLAVFSRQEVK